MQGINETRRTAVTMTRWSKSTKMHSDMPLYKDDLTATAHLVTVAERLRSNGHAYVQRDMQGRHRTPTRGMAAVQPN